jgi:hypothetical protein
MSTRTDALVSQRETGKITASIIPVVAGYHPARAITTCEADYGSNHDLGRDREADSRPSR